MSVTYRIGVDENGLGARLGPLLVTGVLASVEPGAAGRFEALVIEALGEQLGDSKRLVSHGNVALGEAWARAVTGEVAASPAALLEHLELHGTAELRALCPSRAQAAQCWPSERQGALEDEVFGAPAALVERVHGHLARLAALGVHLRAARSALLCTRWLNLAREQGRGRFVEDLHAMERVVLHLRERADGDVLAVCGKVGGLADYGRCFGPLAGRPHLELARGAALSSYRVPGLGELRFVRDADATDPLVMLASLIGKYLRELAMRHITAHYQALAPGVRTVSGYHDPLTDAFVQATSEVRASTGVDPLCFERTRTAGSRPGNSARSGSSARSDNSARSGKGPPPGDGP